jgi:hypothetical protein
MKMNLREIKKHVNALSARQLQKLDAWIHVLLQGADTTDDGRTGAGDHQRNHKSYRSEMVRCGKKGCKCANGELHGPYWYAYWTEKGKTQSQYIGKRLPKGIKSARDAKASGV